MGRKGQKLHPVVKQNYVVHPILALPEGSENFVYNCDARIKGRAQILSAQSEARKEENFINEDLHGMINKLEPRADEFMLKQSEVWIPCLVIEGP
ncbi:hypothetical protein Tco_0881991 [Tanacetum coccineum]